MGLAFDAFTRLAHTPQVRLSGGSPDACVHLFQGDGFFPAPFAEVAKGTGQIGQAALLHVNEELAIIGQFEEELGRGLEAEGIDNGFRHGGLVFRGQRGFGEHVRNVMTFLVGVKCRGKDFSDYFDPQRGVTASVTGCSRALFSLAIMPRGVTDSENCDEVAPEPIGNSIGKARWEKPANVPTPVAETIDQGIFGQSVDGAPNGPREVRAKSAPNPTCCSSYQAAVASMSARASGRISSRKLTHRSGL